MDVVVARAKCTVIIRLWNFLAILMTKHAKDLSKVCPSVFLILVSQIEKILPPKVASFMVHHITFITEQMLSHPFCFTVLLQTNPHMISM